MTTNLIMDNHLIEYGLFLGCGVIIGTYIYYLFKPDCIYDTKFPTEDIDAILAETTANSNQNTDQNLTDSGLNTDSDSDRILNTDSETDSDLNTDSETDHDTPWNSDSSSDSDSEEIVIPEDTHFIPNVDFDVCSLHELKLFEIKSLYSRQIAENNLTDEDLMEIITFFSDADLCSLWVNNWIIVAIENFDFW